VPELVHAFGCAIWSPDASALTAAQVREAHALGLRVLPWTVNTRAEMTRLIEWGADGIITDFPDRLPPR
jgi:glycerophosphoryl diester phosphodiesterase